MARFRPQYKSAPRAHACERAALVTANGAAAGVHAGNQLFLLLSLTFNIS
jgi:hypothetical protein